MGGRFKTGQVLNYAVAKPYMACSMHACIYICIATCSVNELYIYKI